ncbi:MAG TPA: NAD(P)H-hydrate dehydratase [Sphingomicrobium sp.]|nr:NAD(P)H-hydrate dehydratase [Sphingomicrobium sp.]
MKLDRSALRAHPLPPVVDGDKETKGRILIVAGSREVPGAALLAATAAMRAGAGKLRIATVESIAIPIGVAMPEAMVAGLAEDRAGGFAAAAAAPIADLAADVDAVVAGPGVKRSRACADIAAKLMRADVALALDVAMLKALRLPNKHRAITPLLLPDADELASLLDCREDEVERDPLGCGRRTAERYRAIVLVKGATSHVVTPGGDVWTQSSGAPGLGVSGSGDVLAGIVGGLLARGAEPVNALLWAVWLHGQAGARLAKKVGPLGFLAREIADEIPALLPG